MTEPLQLFEQWFAEAGQAGVIEPNAMVLSTTAENKRPSSRVVLLKETMDGGYYFFTNYSSRKAKELDAAPFASLNFHWRAPFNRQVRIEGEVKRASAEISDRYFAARPRGSQIGAWASPQSREIKARAILEERVKEVQHRFQNEETIPLPPYWGGYCLNPRRIEFWKNGVNRLHDRFLYTRNNGDQAGWTIQRLAP